MSVSCRMVVLAVGLGLAMLAAEPAAAQDARKPAPPATLLPKDKPAATKVRVRELPYRNSPFTGDLDKMLERRLIRVLVVFNRTEYFVDKGQPRGAMYELVRAFEDEINRRHKPKQKQFKTRVYFVPVSRDELIPSLREGRGDIAASVLTVTPGREKLVDFSAPFATGVKEVFVSGPRAAAPAKVDDLAGREVYVRRSSSFWEHLEGLNARFTREGKKPVLLRPVPEELETDDLLEMVNAGLIGITVADRWKANLWSNLLKSIAVHEDFPLTDDNDIAWMIREHSPKLKAELDAFMKKYGEGTSVGNTIMRRYMQNTQFIREAASDVELAKFHRVVEIFQRYGAKYDLNALLMIAQGYQESQLNQQAKSPVGAIGIMQIMPATGAELKVGDIRKVEPNVEGGVKYVRFLIDTYYADEPMDDFNKTMFAFASYNAGPGRVQKLRAETAKMGLDPNRWFGNVETVAAKRVGSETVSYVSNIFKYYVAYAMLEEERIEREKALEKVKRDAGG